MRCTPIILHPLLKGDTPLVLLMLNYNLILQFYSIRMSVNRDVGSIPSSTGKVHIQKAVHRVICISSSVSYNYISVINAINQ